MGFLGLFSVAAGAMISSGVFVLPGVVFSQVGPALWLSYVIAGGIALIGILAVIELTTAMPRAGGNYFYVTRSLGPFMGTVTGVISWFAVALKSAFAIYGLASFLGIWLGLPYYPIAVVIVVVFTLINLLGTDFTSRIETALVLILLAIIAGVIAGGWSRVNPGNLTPFFLEGRSTRDLLIATGLVFVSFGGLVNVSSVAEEVKRPALNIPAATLAAIAVVTLLYGLLIRVAIGVSGGDAVAGAANPIADAARIIAGGPGGIAVTVAAVLAFVTTAIAGLLSASRYPLALARDGLAPALLGRTAARSGIPVPAVMLTSLTMIGALALELRLLIEAASVVIALNYMLSNISVVVMRNSGVVGYRPSFRVPLSPWLPSLAILVYIALVADLGLEAILIALGFALISAVVFLIWGRKADSKEYALQHIVERLTNRELTDAGLEDELREIVHESRGVQTDRVDQLFQSATCIDLNDERSLDELFTTVATRLAEPTGQSARIIREKLVQREADSSTALSPFIAVPHLILPCRDNFHLGLVRSARGIRFSDVAPEVKAVFVLMGAQELRTLHLQALAAIAQVSQDPKFDDRWLSVRKESQLRDVVLLTHRRRV